MPTRRNPLKVSYPAGADSALLKRLTKRAITERRKLLDAEHREFVTNAKVQERGLLPLIDVMGVDRKKVEKAVASIRAANRKRFGPKKPPAFKPLKEHNPTRYAPFDMTWSHVSGGGITGVIQYGPYARTGQTGFSIGIFNGGSLSTVSSVGFWYYPTSSGTLHVTLNASVYGSAFVYSALLGYASAYAGLRVYVERYSSDFKVFRSTNPIYDHGGILEFDISSFIWVNRSVTISLPARKNTWYGIWADAVQRATAGGIADSVSNFSMYMGPVHYWVN